MNFDKDMESHKVLYDDGDVEYLELDREQWRLEGSAAGFSSAWRTVGGQVPQPSLRFIPLGATPQEKEKVRQRAQQMR